MSLVVKNSRQLIDPAHLKLKMLLVALPGFGKTTFLSTVPDIGVAVCEDGHGKGLLSVAGAGIEYVEPTTYEEFDTVCSGLVPAFKTKAAIGLDSLSNMAKTFIKDKALSIPRQKGDSQKRKMGVPELDDYGMMAELTRRLIAKLLNQDKHVIVTATLRIQTPDAETGQGEFLIGPDLPGQMFLGSTAMFDLVLVGRSRTLLKDPKDAKSKYTERYWVTESTGGIVAKNRLVAGGQTSKPLLAPEEIYDPATGRGTFPYLLEKVSKAYAAQVQPAAA